MRKSVLLILSFFIMAQFAKAQLYVGLEGGGLVDQLIGFGKPSESKITVSPMSGVFFDGFISDMTSVLTEIRYERRVLDYRDTIPFILDGKVHVIEKTDYLTVPVHLKFNAGDQIFNTFILFGAEFAVPVFKHQQLDVTIQGLPVPPEDYSNFEHNFFDYGLSAGLGFQSRGFYMKGNYYYGLRNFYQGKNIMEIRHSFYGLTAGFLFNYVAPSVYHRTSGIQAIKYRLKKAFK